METTLRRDTDLESTMQFTGPIVDISLAPGNDRAAFDLSFGQVFRVEMTERGYNFGNGIESVSDYARTKRFRWIRVPMRGRYIC